MQCKALILQTVGKTASIQWTWRRRLSKIACRTASSVLLSMLNLTLKIIVEVGHSLKLDTVINPRRCAARHRVVFFSRMRTHLKQHAQTVQYYLLTAERRRSGSSLRNYPNYLKLQYIVRILSGLRSARDRAAGKIKMAFFFFFLIKQNELRHVFKNNLLKNIL